MSDQASDVKSAGYEVIYDILLQYTHTLEDEYLIHVPSYKKLIDRFIVENPSTIDTFFQRVRSYFN